MHICLFYLGVEVNSTADYGIIKSHPDRGQEELTNITVCKTNCDVHKGQDDDEYSSMIGEHQYFVSQCLPISLCVLFILLHKGLFVCILKLIRIKSLTLTNLWRAYLHKSRLSRNCTQIHTALKLTPAGTRQFHHIVVIELCDMSHSLIFLIYIGRDCP